MRVVIPLKELKSALGLVSKVVHDRAVKPALACVKITATDGGTTLEGTDLSCSAKVRMLGVQVDEPGSVLVPRARLLAVASKVAKADAGVLITSGETDKLVDVEILMACHTLAAPMLDLFPSFDVPDLAAGPHFDLDCGDLATALARTVFATDEQSTRFALGGVQLEVAPGGAPGLVAVATDGRRLAAAEIPADASGPDDRVLPPTCVLPAELCRTLLRLLDKSAAGDRALLAVADGRCTVDVAGSVVSGRLVEGRFPRWRDVAEPGQVLAALLLPDIAGLASVVKAAAIATDADAVGVVLEFDGAGRLLAWGASERGNGQVDMDVPYVGTRLRLTVAPDLFLPALAAIPEGVPVTVQLQGDGAKGIAGGPLRLTVPGLTVVMMPLADARPSRLPAPATAGVA